MHFIYYDASVSVKVYILENMAYLFSIVKDDNQWIIPFDEWLSNIFEN